MKILGTGLSGLVGSRVVEILSSDWQFTNLSLDTGIDITNKDSLTEIFEKADYEWVFHFAAYTDVDLAEKQKDQGELSLAWKVNVQATDNIVTLCKEHNKRLLYISTDYVFDGKKEFYTEEDTPNPLGWYGKTKYEGEKLVQRLREKSLIIRIANPYRAKPVGKTDFVHKIRDKLQNGESLVSPVDQIITPTFIDDIANGIYQCITKGLSGIFHIVGADSLSAYDASIQINEIFNCKKTNLGKTTCKDFFLDRAPRPCCAVLKHDKISKYGITPHTFRLGLEKVKLIEGENL